VDASLAVRRQDDLATLTVEYMKDGAEGIEVAFRSKKVVIGEDANGRETTSLVMERLDGEASTGADGKKKTWPRALRVFRAAMIEAVLSSGFDYKIVSGPTVKAVDLDHVRDVFYKIYVVNSDPGAPEEQRQDSRKHAFSRCLEKAQALTLIAARVEGIRQVVWLVSPFEGDMHP
jgi:hypothetical protein